MSEIRDLFCEVKDPKAQRAEQYKAVLDIRHCRTPEMGGHLLKCEDCGSGTFRFHSCGNRSCPVCQGLKQQIWIEKRKAEALSAVTYYHIVFTVPDLLNRAFLQDPAKMYSILFCAASRTLLTLGQDPRWLGGKTGFIAVLHTWGSNLSLHPHLHVIMPGCALNGDKVVHPMHPKFLFPVKVMGTMFRGKFLALMKKSGMTIPSGVYRHKWVTYLKDTVDGDHVIEYLGRYTHRAAITDARIKAKDDTSVTFSYKDYRSGRCKWMTLQKEEFCRRFLLHVLPAGFRKIRFYGFLANRNKQADLQKLCELLECTLQEYRFADMSQTQIAEHLYGKYACPCCGSRKIIFIALPLHRRE